MVFQLATIGDRKYVLVTARQHPGEANSSWIMEGFLRWVLGDSPEVREPKPDSSDNEDKSSDQIIIALGCCASKTCGHQSKMELRMPTQ